MKILFVLHDPPYGTERTYNGIRWARQMLEDDVNEVRVFLFGDAVAAAAAGQKTPDGYYNLGNMIRGLVSRNADVGCCGACLDARGINEENVVTGAHRSSMKELATWTMWADRTINV
ncbi:DsrE family protein [Streptosporangium sp. NPDC049046]|uniref:DsrE/DsrF/TusD sulfur relay family protein n=1 Tax=Streptosporangium sp. NPDC049046 TaxID=3155031 RepID=UPI0034176A95